MILFVADCDEITDGKSEIIGHMSLDISHYFSFVILVTRPSSLERRGENLTQIAILLNDVYKQRGFQYLTTLDNAKPY